jgi:hypothetical protein
LPDKSVVIEDVSVAQVSVFLAATDATIGPPGKKEKKKG